MTLLEVAKKSNVSIEALQEIVQENRTPTLNEIKAIAKAIRLPVSKLLESSDKQSSTKVLFRNNRPRNLKQYVAVEKLSFIIDETYRHLSGKVGADIINVFPKLGNTYQNAIQLAGVFRTLFVSDDQERALLDLADITSNRLNCLLFIIDVGADGGSAYIGGLSYVFVSPRFKPRMLFTLAHEIAHLLIHHEKDKNYININIDNNTKYKGQNEIENFANAFASNLLLPLRGVVKVLKEFRAAYGISGDIGDVEIINIAYHFGVSFDVAARRCEDLELLPKGAAYSLHEAIVKAHGSAEKRALEVGFNERMELDFPQRVSSNVLMALVDSIENGDISIGRVSEVLDISIEDILSFKSTMSK